MQFIKQKDGSLNIIVADEDDYECTGDNGVDVILSPEQLSELVSVVSPHHPAAPDKILNIHNICKLCDATSEECEDSTPKECLALVSEYAATIRNETLDAVITKLSKLTTQLHPYGSRIVWVPVIEVAIKELRSSTDPQEQKR